jgi:DNA-binding response OmpR family regulator
MPQKILLVDDEDIIHQSVKRALEKSPYELLSAYNGNEAVKKVLQSVPDLVILDINMPEKDGYAVVREIRGNKQTKHIPIIMLTGLGEVIDKVVGYELGVEDYMTKPFDVEKLRRHAERLLNKEGK